MKEGCYTNSHHLDNQVINKIFNDWTMPITEIALLLAAYLLGSISSAVIVCRVMGITDPRNSGSRNPGATNVLRIGGRKAGILTFAGDLSKGILPVLVANMLEFSVLWTSAIVVAVFLGHCLPLFFSFVGGKGVATVFGAVTTMNWQIGLVLLVVWVLVFFIFRIASLSGLISALVLPIASWILSPEIVLPMLIMSLLLIWRHQRNIKNLLTGKEYQFKKND